MSEADIDAGDRWAQAVAGELDDASFGIVCLTPENLAAPWILFEAGALAKSIEFGRVVPVLLDLDFGDLSGPLAQFQAKKLTKQGVGEIIGSIQSAATVPVPDDRAKQLVEALWAQMEESLDKVPQAPADDRQVRPQEEILEELVSSIRTLDVRMRESEDILMRLPKRGAPARSSPRNHAVLREMSHYFGADDPLSRALILASILREEFPWLYDMVAELFRSQGGPRSRASVDPVDLASRLDYLRDAGTSMEWDAVMMDSISELQFVLFDYAQTRRRSSGGPPPAGQAPQVRKPD